MITTDTTEGAVNIIDAREQKPEAPKPLTAEEKAKDTANWDAARNRMNERLDRARGIKPAAEESKDKTKADKPKAESEKQEPEAKQDAKPDAKKSKLRPTPEVPQAPPVDVKALATEVAAATAKAIRGEKPPEPDPDADFPQARRRDLPVVKKLEEMEPARYRGVTEQFRKFAKAEQSYRSKWEQENPGQNFDMAADEHTAWYDKHEPKIEPDDLTDARTELVVERRLKPTVEKETAGTKSELENLKMEISLRDADSAAPGLLNQTVPLIVAALGEDVAKEVAKGESLEKTNPLAHSILVETIPVLNQQVRAAARIFATNGRAYDGKNPAHQAVAAASAEVEKMISEQDTKAKTTPDGRTFVTLDEWANLTPDKRAQHWTVDSTLVSVHLANKAAQTAGDRYQGDEKRLKEWAEKNGYAPKASGKEAKASGQAETQTARESEEDERSPSSSTRSAIQPGTRVDPKTGAVGGDKMLSRMFRR